MTIHESKVADSNNDNAEVNEFLTKPYSISTTEQTMEKKHQTRDTSAAGDEEDYNNFNNNNNDDKDDNDDNDDNNNTERGMNNNNNNKHDEIRELIGDDRKITLNDGVIIDSNGDDNDDEEEENQFPADVFTMMFFAHPISVPNLYATIVFILQLSILGVIAVDLTQDDDRRSDEGSDDNKLNVPPIVTTQVRVAQIIAILIASISNTDVTHSLELLSVGWRQSIQELFPYATCYKFVISNLLRICEGICVIGVSFILIVQPDTVLDIFLNFAAVQFVAGLDDLAYHLASDGWLGSSMKHFNSSIENIKLSAQKKKIDWVLVVKPVLVLALLTLLYSSFFGIAIRQSNGTILKNTSCKIVEVKFGDEVYTFSEDDNYRFQTIQVASPIDVSSYFQYDDDDSDLDDVTFDNYYDDFPYDDNSYRQIVGSNRILGIRFDPLQPPDIHYAYFSGTYYANFDHLESSRPTYYESNDRDITSGMFYYCDKEKSWVFTIPAFMDAGAIPEHNNKCKYGWLLRSPITSEFTLDNAPAEGWKVWTGVLEPTQDFSITCTECNNDFECGTSERGICNNKNRCECNRGVAEGYFCHEEAACDDLVLFQNARYGHQGTPFPDETVSQLTFRNIRSVVSENIVIHGKPAYYLKQERAIPIYEVLLYTGRRWYDAYFRPVEFPLEAEDTPAKKELFTRFHAYWNNLLLSNVRFISEPTDKHVLTGPLKWYTFNRPLSMGNYGAFPAREAYNQRFECYSVDCSIFDVCGYRGNCTAREMIVEDDGYELKGNQCNCPPNIYGHFCEFVCDTISCSDDDFLSSESPSSTPSSSILHDENYTTTTTSTSLSPTPAA